MEGATAKSRADGRPDANTRLGQRAVCEGLGTAFLLAAVVGSGIMAQKLAGGNGALALLCNTLPTGAILAVLILVFGPLSGAHFNPAVSIGFALRGELSWRESAVYIAAQVLGAVAGVWPAHLMFELPVWQLSATVRTGLGPMAGGGGCHLRPAAHDLRLRRAKRRQPCPTRSGSTSPRPTGSRPRRRSPIRRSRSRARCPTPSPASRPGGAPGFIIAQLAGMLAAVAVAGWLWPAKRASA